MLSKVFNLNGTNGNEVHIISISHEVEYNYKVAIFFGYCTFPYKQTTRTRRGRKRSNTRTKSSKGLWIMWKTLIIFMDNALQIFFFFFFVTDC
jgi:hypothetical protein